MLNLKVSYLLLPLMTACGAAVSSLPSDTSSDDSAMENVKMQHQILFQNKEDSQVFEGVMIRRTDGYIVQAFAGPGVDLFTVARSGERHKETLHIQSLAARIDVSKIGEDIFCIYMKGCVSGEAPAATQNKAVSCVQQGRRMTEHFDADGRLTARRFPDAHGIGLFIQYDDYRSFSGRSLPVRIVLRWGNSERSLTIHTVSAETADGEAGAVIDRFLR